MRRAEDVVLQIQASTGGFFSPALEVRLSTALREHAAEALEAAAHELRTTTYLREVEAMLRDRARLIRERQNPDQRQTSGG